MLNKFHAKSTIIDGQRFDSHLEAQFFLDMQKAGVHLVPHPPKVLLIEGNGEKIEWKVDFLSQDGTTYYEVKGKEMADYRLKRKLWKILKKEKLIIVKKAPGLRFPWSMGEV